jgi:hypothetical protein
MGSTATTRADWEQAPGDLFLTERAPSGLRVARRGRPGKRLVRRDVARTFLQVLRSALRSLRRAGRLPGRP